MATTPCTAALKVVLANTFVMYFKAHANHWNIEGKNFSEYHEFFGDLYDELFTAVDAIAEHIRAEDEYAPISLEDLYSAKTIMEDNVRPQYAAQMFGNLLSANNQVIDSLNSLFQAATAAGKQGLANFAADRLDIHAKHGWMLRSTMKSGD